MLKIDFPSYKNQEVKKKFKIKNFVNVWIY